MTKTNLVGHYAQVARQHVAAPGIATERGLNELLRALGRWRSKMIANTIIKSEGLTIQSGPFAGMTYVDHATEGCLAPRLLGCYESELHPAIEAFAGQGLDAVIDIGCAEGYYAVGLARTMPTTQVFAYDIDAKARASCQALARTNGVEDRVHVGGAFQGEMFADFADRSTLVFIDAEGFEDDILKPDDWPALRGMNLIVETHDLYRPGTRQRLIDRFSPSHEIEVIDHHPKITVRPDWLKKLGHLDQLIAIWEWRAGPTPWLVMRPR